MVLFQKIWNLINPLVIKIIMPLYLWSIFLLQFSVVQEILADVKTLRSCPFLGGDLLHSESAKKVDCLAEKNDFLKPGPKKGIERAPEWSQEIRGQFSGNLYWENHCIVCVLSWLISYTWGFLPWECCWSVSGMIIIIVSGGKRRGNLCERGDVLLEKDKICLGKERKSLWVGVGKYFWTRRKKF